MSILTDAPDLIGYRVIAVHAHPDDESITTGGTLFDLAQRGADVLVVTCTLGEEGEVIGDTYQHLVNDNSRGADQLGGFRIHELNRALDILGVRGQFLGGAGRFRDSGMAGSRAHKNPRAFVNQTPAATQELTEIFRRERPHLVITYGADGGYGHPDHIQAHRITHAAAELAGTVQRIVWTVTSREAMLEATEKMLVIPEGWQRPDQEYIDNATDPTYDLVVELDDAAFHAKREAMRAHATQVWFADGSVSATNPQAAWGTGVHPVWALSNLLAQPLLPYEWFQMGVGQLPSGGLLSELAPHDV